MTTFLRTFNNNIMDRIREDLDANTSNYYIFAGKYKEWEDDNFPPNTDLSVQSSEFDVRNDILFGKRISSLDTSKLIRNIPWESGNIYSYYDHRDPDLLNKDFYVVNSSNNVYKCLYNNNDSPSLFEPSYVGTTTSTTADGYIWKYMYTITSQEANRFSIPDYVPVVANTDIQNAAVGGTIEIILIDNGGENYQVFNTGTIQTVVSNTVFRIENTASATNNIYTDSSLYIETGTGAGSISRISQYISNTSGKFVTVEDPLSLDTSSEYIISPRVVINGDGSGIVAYSTVDLERGIVDGIFVQNTGQDYTFASVEIEANTVHGTGATATAIISPLRGHGFDPSLELGSDVLIITTDFEDTESNTIPTDIGFRQTGLIKNVEYFANTDLYNDFTFNHTVKFDTSYIADTAFSAGEILQGTVSNARAEVIRADINTAKVMMISPATFINGETVISQNTSIQAVISNTTGRDINKFTGEILYYSNFSPLERQELSSETVKLVIRI